MTMHIIVGGLLILGGTALVIAKATGLFG